MEQSKRICFYEAVTDPAVENLPVHFGGYDGGMRFVMKKRSLDVKSPRRGKQARTPPVAILGEALPDAAWSEDIRAYYDAVIKEPVPQEFIDLLAQIAKDIPD